MRLLVIGGTVFLGRHIVAAARARGHELTLFNRGRSDPRPMDGVEQIHGDRERDLALLAPGACDQPVQRIDARDLPTGSSGWPRTAPPVSTTPPARRRR